MDAKVENKENRDQLDREDLKKVRGGTDYGSPHFEGKLCPECGACPLHFWKFQENNGEIQEVYNCGPVVMHLNWDYGY